MAPDWKREIRERLASLTLSPLREADIVEELAQHLEDRYEEMLLAGATEEDAYRSTLAELSESQLLARGLRRVERPFKPEPVVLGARRTSVLRDFWQDLRYSLRMQRKSPGFTAVAVLSLALGIGANTAVFSVLDALMLKQLPVQNAEQLVTLNYVHDGESENFSYPIFEKLRDDLPASDFSSISAVREMWQSNVRLNGAGDNSDGGNVLASLVSGNYFSTLGVTTIAGRTFTSNDDRVPGGHPVTVISYDYWNRRLASAPDVVGRTLTLNNVTYSIIGVTRPGFSGDWVGRSTDLWIPIAMAPQVNIERPDCLTNPNQTWLRIIARLAPGATPPQTQAATDVVWRRALSVQSRFAGDVTPKVEQYASGYSPERKIFTQPLAMLMVVVGLVLLIACANIATLLLARSAARQQEMTVRVALGASAVRLARQLLTESLLLSIIGGTLGLFVAVEGTEALVRFLSSGPQSNNLGSLAFQLNVRPDARVLVFTAAVCLFTGLLFGMIPACSTPNVSLTSALGARGADSGGSKGRFRLGQWLVVSQVALSLLLLVGAGLFVRTLRNLKSQDLGFEGEHLLLVWTWPGQSGRKGPELANYYEMVQERISALPGVLSASPSMKGLLREPSPRVRVTVPGMELEDPNYPAFDLVAPKFFETAGIRLLMGRDFSANDTETAPHVAILNEYTAHLYFGDQNPIGRTFGAASSGQGPPFIDIEVVGIVRNIKGNLSLRETDRRMIYFPYRQDLQLKTHPRLVRMCLAVHTIGDPARMKDIIRNEFRRMDPSVPVTSMESMDEQLNEAVAQERLIAALSACFGALAVLLASIGLYGVISYTVARRRSEVGVRLALGATPGKVLRMILTESLMLVLVGIGIGVPAALAVTRLISARLFGVSAADPLSFVAAALLMIGVAALAAFLPARRASRVDPLVALRYE